MYYFKTKEGVFYGTKFSPREIACCDLFDAILANGNTILLEEYKVNYKSFYYQS